MKQYECGLQGEALAEAYLCKMGMQVLRRRYRGQDGEIDLIMKDGVFIVFVEVKMRSKGAPGSGFAAVTHAKQRRLCHAALAYLLDMEWTEHLVRFDVVEISREGILHIPNAFMYVQ